MSMNDREKALENKFAHDQQTFFKIEARASKLIGMWAAEQMGLTAPDASAYAKEVVASNLDEPGFDDVRRKVLSDLAAAKVEVTDHMFETILARKLDEARKQIEDEAKS